MVQVQVLSGKWLSRQKHMKDLHNKCLSTVPGKLTGTGKQTTRALLVL